MIVYGLNEAGIVLDMIGAGLLAYGLASTQDADIRRLTNPDWRELGDVEGLVLSRQDTRWGMGYVGLGFALQLIGSWVSNAGVVAGLVTYWGFVILGCYAASRRRRAQPRIDAIKQERSKLAKKLEDMEAEAFFWGTM